MRCVFPVLVDGETSFAICLGELHNRVFYRVFDDDLYPAYRHASSLSVTRPIISCWARTTEVQINRSRRKVFIFVDVPIFLYRVA